MAKMLYQGNQSNIRVISGKLFGKTFEASPVYAFYRLCEIVKGMGPFNLLIEGFKEAALRVADAVLEDGSQSLLFRFIRIDRIEPASETTIAFT